MKRIIMFLLLSVVAYGRMSITATIFPVYDAARIIVGDRAEVSLLVKPGVEPHSFEPSPRDIARINNSDILFYLDESMETWIGKFTRSIDTESFRVSEGVEFIEEGSQNNSPATDDGHDHSHRHDNGRDPHIWLDPLRYITVVENIYRKLSELDGENEEYYRENYERHLDSLMKLHEEYLDLAARSRYKKIIYAGHFSFGYFVERYGFEYESVYKNLSPNAGISPRDLQKVIRTIKESGQKYIFKEALVNSKTAKLIGEEAGTEVLLLHQMGGVGKEDMNMGRGYLEIMHENLVSLRKGLEYGKDN